MIKKHLSKYAQEEYAKKLAELKSKRFTLTARLLGEKQTTVHVIDDNQTMPAVYDTSCDKLYLNEAHPRTTDQVKALIYDRGKLFHELGHCRWTQKECDRETLANQLKVDHGEKARGQFMAMSNVLEDGRIERLLKMKWEGSAKYLDAILENCVEGNNPVANSPFGSLPLYVRKGIFKNERDAAFWQPYLADIENARTSITTRNVCKIAADLVEKVGHLLPDIPLPKPPPAGDGDKDSDSDSDSDGDSDKDSDGDSDSDKDSGKGAGGGDEIDKIVSGAFAKCLPEAQDLLDQLEEEINEDKSKVQEFETPEEEAQAEQLAEIFRSILTEMNRKKLNQCREGKLSQPALTKALTNRRCFATPDTALGTPYVALLLDISGSMSDELESATGAARIVNGALQKSGIESCFITFGGCVYSFDTVPLRTPNPEGSTATGSAMEAANKWLEGKESERSLMIVITDGAPNDIGTCINQKQRCAEHGGHVLGIIYDNGIPRKHIEKMAHSYVGFSTSSCSAQQSLPDLLEPRLAAFLIGGSDE